MESIFYVKKLSRKRMNLKLGEGEDDGAQIFENMLKCLSYILIVELASRMIGVSGWLRLSVVRGGARVRDPASPFACFFLSFSICLLVFLFLLLFLFIFYVFHLFKKNPKKICLILG